MIAKAQMRKPASRVKDRLVVVLIQDAEDIGYRRGMTLIEAIGGNTGIGLAFAAATRGYKLILTMPEAMSEERVALLRHYGAKVALTAGILMGNAVKRAQQLDEQMSNALYLYQFKTPANPKVHVRTTGREIWQDTEGNVDVLVSAVGTGGTLSGAGQYLKVKQSDVTIIAAETAGAAVFSVSAAGQHQLAPGSASDSPRRSRIEALSTKWLWSKTKMRLAGARRLAQEEGIPAGVSSGAAMHAALKVAAREALSEQPIVVILPDTGDR